MKTARTFYSVKVSVNAPRGPAGDSDRRTIMSYVRSLESIRISRPSSALLLFPVLIQREHYHEALYVAGRLVGVCDALGIDTKVEIF